MPIPKKYVKPRGPAAPGRGSLLVELRRPLRRNARGELVARSNDTERKALALLSDMKGSRVSDDTVDTVCGNGKPIVVRVETYRVKVPIDRSASDVADHFRRFGASAILEGTRGVSTLVARTINPIAVGSGADLQAKHSSAARKRELYRETERNGTAKELDFLAFVYGPAYLNNRFAQPSLLASLEEFAREATGQELPEAWTMQADYWLKKLKEWNDLPERHLRRARAEIDCAVNECRMDDYANWQAIEQRILAFTERKRVLADSVVERDDNGEVITVVPAIRPAARMAIGILAKIEAVKAKEEAEKKAGRA